MRNACVCLLLRIPIFTYLLIAGVSTELVKIMKKTGAKVTWATTTPIPDMAKTGQTAASVVERNEAAAKVMAKHSIPSVDLFTYITPHLETVRRTNDVHFHPEGYQMLSEAVAAFIEKEL